jgi:hypothetical protein
VHQPAGVDRGETLGKTRAERAHPVRRQRRAPVDVVLQRGALDERRHHPRRIGPRVGVDHRGGVEPPTRRAASISRANRSRNCAASACAG